MNEFEKRDATYHFSGISTIRYCRKAIENIFYVRKIRTFILMIFVLNRRMFIHERFYVSLFIVNT
jgi:hypothetical protein